MKGVQALRLISQGSAQLPVLPVLVRGLAGAAGLASLRTVPQGSAEGLASGIFFRDSL